MKSLIKQSLSWVIILTILPSLVGIGLVHHHCTTCSSHQTETTLLLMPHNHSSETCEIEKRECALPDNGSTQDKSHEHHSHHCQVDFYLLDIPGQLTEARKLVPTLSSLQCLFSTSLFHTSLFPQESSRLMQAFFTIPPLLERSQNPQRLSKNAVFRL